MNKILATFFFCTLLSICSSQSINDFLDSYEGENSIPYLQPLADLFTSNLHSGISDWSKIDTGFHIKLGIVAMSSFPSRSQRTFTGRTDTEFDPEQTAVAPTIIGSVEPVRVEGVNGTAYVFPGGYNLKTLPMAAPQLSIGNIYHTEFYLRYFAFDLEHDLGSVSLFGLGFRHSLNSYLPKLPFDLSVGYCYHNFKDSTYINSKLNLAAAYIGKSGKWWSSQLMLGYQQSSTNIRYTFDQGDQIKNINITLNNKNKFIAELSAAAKLWILIFHGAISYSGPVTISAGAGFWF